MIDNWNAVVGHKDLTYILGDFAWRNHSKYLQRLHGKKILIRGNHDEMSKVEEQQFTGVFDILDRKFNGNHIVMFHYPMRGWPDASLGSRHLFGHFHGRMEEFPGTLAFDIGVDVWDYKPVPLEVVESKFAVRAAYREANPNPKKHEDMLGIAAKNREENVRYKT